MSLKISTRPVGDVILLDLKGNIVLGEESAMLRDTIRKVLAEGKKKILLNMAEVNYIDSSGNGTMVAAWSATRDQGGVLKLVNPTPRFREFLQVTKLVTLYEVFSDEVSAIASFHSSHLRCHCPICQSLAAPGLADGGEWPVQSCARCKSQFTVSSLASSGEEIQITSLQIQTYEREYFEVLPGQHFTVNIVGRLNLFSLSALCKAWRVIPMGRRAIFDLSRTTEVEGSSWNTLLTLLAGSTEGTRAVVSLEGISPGLAAALDPKPPVYAESAAALKALGGVSPNSPWLARTTRL